MESIIEMKCLPIKGSQKEDLSFDVFWSIPTGPVLDVIVDGQQCYSVLIRKEDGKVKLTVEEHGAEFGSKLKRLFEVDLIETSS